jgi:AraC family transcriptional regulator of adaptative response/methylated-DNA-[protein]-cysteine methyltransferase
MLPTVVDYRQMSEDYRRVEQAIRYIESHYRRQPDLDEVASSVGLSEYHFQRLFTRWVGISPKRFLQYLTKEGAKQLLEASESLLDVTFEVGLSSPSRLHDLFVTCDAVTPGEYKNRGLGLKIAYGVHPSPFGDCLLAVTERGICYLGFVDDGNLSIELAELHRRWSLATIHEDTAMTRPLVGQIFNPIERQASFPLRLYMNGTNFQIKVWEALLQVPLGRVVTYQDLAIRIGAPTAARAVGNAVAKNPVPVIIPCHRVIRKEGEFGNYRYGTARKMALLGWEAAMSEMRG